MSGSGGEGLPSRENSVLATLIGQDELCIEVYRLVITRPGWDVAEIARHLRVPKPDVLEKMDRLAELSMLLPSKETKNAVVIDPEVSLASYIHQRERQIHSQQVELASVRAATARLAAAHASGRAHHSSLGLERLEGIDEVRARLTELARNATGELLAFMPGGAQSEEALQASRPLDEASLAAGVAVRTIYLDSVRNDRATIQYAHWLSELGGETRTLPSLPLRMLIADEAVALVPIDPENSRAGAVVMQAPGVVTALVALFHLLWERATPLGAPHPPASDAPTSQEMALLQLLAQGQTDEVVSRKMGLSLRTTRRMMASVSAKLGARSRFEAGILAARAGWL
ncbi:LuxR C-terminal-related transcriptional regulator [Streptomyces sp. NPDC087428]|uniref:LuxR C-terminal-related transcriptional regulator n=1 Tax=Streptomyces sp. NPDC087428 TaxID=3365788 RepID=UPI00381DCFBD